MKLKIEDHAGNVIAEGSLKLNRRIGNHALATLRFRGVSDGWMQNLVVRSATQRWRMHAMSMEGFGETYLTRGRRYRCQVLLKEPPPRIRVYGLAQRLTAWLTRRTQGA